MMLKSFELSSRVIAFIAIMVALGNALSAISIGLSRVNPQIGIDLSHIATFIAAIYCGPAIGFLTALFSGIVPGVYFGPMGGLSWLGLIGLPIGKSLTGLTTGALYKLFNVNQRDRPSLWTIPAVFIGFIPECLFTVFFFLGMVPFFFGWVSVPLLITILVKAWFEIAFMSFFMGMLRKSVGFSTFMAKFLLGTKTRG